MPEVTSISIHRNLTNQTRVSNSEANTNREYIYIYMFVPISRVSYLMWIVYCHPEAQRSKNNKLARDETISQFPISIADV